MSPKLDETLVKDFPLLYRGRHKSKYESCMSWGFSCDDGWYPLIRKLSEKLEKIIQELPESDRFEAAQVKEKFGCYDKDTEVLTRSGWKYFSDVTYEDEIATLTNSSINVENDGYLEYQCPTDIIKYQYNGKMYKIVGKGVNLLVTPNHNLYIAKKPYYNHRKSRIKNKLVWSNKQTDKIVRHDYPFKLSTYDKYIGKDKMFKKDVKWIGKNINTYTLPEYKNKWKCGWGGHNISSPPKTIKMNDFLRFLGWYIAEGSVSHHDGKLDGAVALSLNNTDNGIEKNMVSDIIKSIGFQCSVEKNPESSINLHIYEKRLAIWLANNCGEGVYNKRVPEFIKKLCPKQIEIFLDNLYLGDGTTQKTSRTLTTVSKQLSDDVQELLLKAGFTFKSGARHRKSPLSKSGKSYCYEVAWLKRSGTYCTSISKTSKKFFEGLVDYNDYVYCVTVPNHVIMIKRNGIPAWCGNSLRFYISGSTKETEKIRAIISEAEIESSKTCEQCGNLALTTSDSDGWRKTLCNSCATKLGYELNNE